MNQTDLAYSKAKTMSKTKPSSNGKSFRNITRTDFKFFPAQILTQAPTGLALEIEKLININEIKSIQIETYSNYAPYPIPETSCNVS